MAPVAQGRIPGEKTAHLGHVAVLSFCIMGLPCAARSDGWSVSGVTGGLDYLQTYQGLIWAPFSTLGESGFVLRGWAKSNLFTYRTRFPGNRKVEIAVHGVSLEAEAGYRHAGEWGSIAAFGGFVWRDHDLHPRDPYSSLDNRRIAFSASLEGDWRLTDRYGLMANGQYVSGFEQYWAQIKPYADLGSGWKVGLDAAYAGGRDYDIGRLGLFTSGYRMDLPWLGALYLGSEAGVKFDLGDDKTDGYAGFHVGRAF